MSVEQERIFNPDPDLYRIRTEYAASLHDYYSKRGYRGSVAIKKACEAANVMPCALKLHLPKYRKKERTLRNMEILHYRSCGYSVKHLARCYGVNRCTISRVIDDFSMRLKISRTMSKKKKPRTTRATRPDPIFEEKDYLFIYQSMRDTFKQ
jgi:DNA-binding NarL/FixJ family response regulator